MISKWKNEFVENASSVFSNPNGRKSQENKELYAEIGKLEMKLDFVKRVSKTFGIPMSAEN